MSMRFKVDRVEVWAAAIKDAPGGMARLLTELREVGADLDFVIARRAPDKPGTGVLFVTPLRGDVQIAAASMLGFNVTNSVSSVRVEGDNRAGIAAELAGRLAAAGINLRGFSASVIGERFVVYLGLDSPVDANRATMILTEA
jgi:hypothetical protein